ncbi:MAG: hypothetical protein QXG00_06245 [Candidatus Woesearchaeota archaeon]
MKKKMRMRMKIRKFIEKIVDNSKPKTVDKITYLLLGIILGISFYLFIATFFIIKTPILKVHPRWVYSSLFILGIGTFYFSMLGDKTNKPNNRPKVFFLISIVLMISTYALLVETLNQAFTSFLKTLVSITDAPAYLMITNIRIISIYVPILVTIFVFYRGITLSFKREYKNELLEYNPDILTRNVDKLTDYTVDVKMCEDIETGEDIVQSEKQAYRHKMIIGSSGSGKTVNSLVQFKLAAYVEKSA